MKIFLDFDDTLFNTRAFIEDMKGVFEECGIPKDLFDRSYQEIKVSFGKTERTYDFDVHLRKLKESASFDEMCLREKVRTFVADSARYLFSDVADFVSLLRKNQCSLFILSFGTSEFQKEKIVGSGLGVSVEKIIITTDMDNKEMALKKEVSSDDKEVWFFDDRMKYVESVKRVFPGIRTVLVKRKEGRYQDEPTSLCDYVVSDLIEGGKIVCGIIS